MLPRYSPYRPDFEAPGPHVTIENRSGIIFQSVPEQDADHTDEDDDFVKYRYYESEKILGKLYRNIDERKIFSEIQERSNGYTTNDMYAPKIMQIVWSYVQEKCHLILWEHQKDWARAIMADYEYGLRSLMKDYTETRSRPLTELEVFIGNVLGPAGAQTKNQRELSTSLKEAVDDLTLWIVNCILKTEGDEWSEESLERCMACLAVSLEENREQRGYKVRDQLLSFKYIAAALCLREVERTFPSA